MCRHFTWVSGISSSCLAQLEQPQTSDLPQQLCKTPCFEILVIQKYQQKEKGKPSNYMLCKEEVKEGKIYFCMLLFRQSGSCIRGMHCQAIKEEGRGISLSVFQDCRKSPSF